MGSNNVVHRPRVPGLGGLGSTLILVFSLLAGLLGAGPEPRARAQGASQPARFLPGIDPQAWYLDHEIEHSWRPGYLHLATGDPSLRTQHGVYAWPFAVDSIGWNIQSYQDYGGTPYFHGGLDMMKVFGTPVYNRSGGQVVNVENYQPGNYLYWEVAVLDPDGYIWQYHHIHQPTIPQLILDKYAEYLADPVNGGFIPANTHVGNIVEWPVYSFGKYFHHIHLNILGAGGVLVNGFEFHFPLGDDDAPEILGVGLLRNGAIYTGNTIEGDYSLYVRARDLVLDDVYYLPPFEVTFSVDGGPQHTTWRFDTLPGGADRYVFLDDFFVVPPTCGDYSCRDFYVDLGFIPNSQFEFPASGGEHTVLVTVSDYDGNATSQAFTYTVIGPPAGNVLWQDDFETDLGWTPNPGGSDTATSGLWERGNPDSTYSGGIKQLGTTFSGMNDLVTGRLAGSAATTYDVDDGTTSIRSPNVVLPADSLPVLSFRYYLAHTNSSSAADCFRVQVVGSTTATVFEELGAANNDDGVWELRNVDLADWAGQTVYLLIEAADAAPESTVVEAAIDDVAIIDTNVQELVAYPQALSTAEDTPLDVVLIASGGNGSPLTYQVVVNPTHGTLSGTPPSLTYVPAADYVGGDSLAFVASDGQTTSAPAEVSIDVTPVNDAPAAAPQSLSTAEDTDIDITLSGSDVDGDALTYRVVLSPSHGILSGTPPSLTYIPVADYDGLDEFVFVAHDGQVDSDPAAVSLDVTPVNDAPAAVPLLVRTRQGIPVAILLSGWDVDGDVLTYQVVAGPEHGTLAGSGPSLIYMPEPGYTGADALTFLVHDGELASPPAEVTISIAFATYLPVTIK